MHSIVQDVVALQCTTADAHFLLQQQTLFVKVLG